MLVLPEAELYINSVLRPAGGKTYDDLNPWSGEVVAKAAISSSRPVLSMSAMT